MKNQNSFTLIELLIVIVVIGVFAFLLLTPTTYACELPNIYSTDKEFPNTLPSTLPKEETNTEEEGLDKYGDIIYTEEKIPFGYSIYESSKYHDKLYPFHDNTKEEWIWRSVKSESEKGIKRGEEVIEYERKFCNTKGELTSTEKEGEKTFIYKIAILLSNLNL